MNNTKIPWTEKTWNPVTGCTKHSAGCAHCYAESIANRFKEAFPNGFNVTLHPERLDEPKKVKKQTMFFVCSMGDLFHDDVPIEYIDKVMEVIKECPQHTFQLLTKRSHRMMMYFNVYRMCDVPDNCWIGTTVENINSVKRMYDICSIGMTKSPIRFLSCEPLLTDLGKLNLYGISWVIVGGESGNQARPMQKEWVLNIQRQCKEQCVPFFFKQWGTYGEDSIKRNVKANGCTIDGQIYQAWPQCYKQ